MQPTITQPSIALEPHPKRHILLKVIIGIILVAIITGATLLVIKYLQQKALDDGVKTELIKQNKLIKASAQNNIFPMTLPDGVKSTDKVMIDATIDMTGTNYCIAATSKTDKKVAYHMAKDTADEALLKGTCADNVTSPPSIPPGFSLGSTGAGAITLQWDKATFASSYVVECATDEKFASGIKTATTDKLMVTLNDHLSSPATYYCHVAAKNVQGQSVWSSTISAKTDAFSTPPAGLSVKTVSTSELEYSWNTVPGATSYLVQYATDTSYMNDVKTITTTDTDVSVSGLKTYTAYYFHVKAITAQFDATSAAYSETMLGRTAQ